MNYELKIAHFKEQIALGALYVYVCINSYFSFNKVFLN